MTSLRDPNTVAAPVDARAQDEEAIRALIAAAVRHQSEPERFLDLHAETVVIVSCTKHVHDGREGAAGELPSSGAMSYVVEESDAGWRIVLAQTTPIRS